MNTALNYKHLHYFWTVAHEGGVGRAAQRLGVSAQTVSGQLARLEHALGQALFKQEGRRLVLTEAGRTALRYADQIFQLGDAMLENLADAALGRTLRLTVGLSDVLPKTVGYRLLEPVFGLGDALRLVCLERSFDELMGELALQRLDLVLADRPAPAGESVGLVSVLLARCPVEVFGTDALAARYRDGFPLSLNGAPMLLPTRDNVLRGQLEQWFDAHNLRPTVVGEFEDGALLKAFGRQGVGLFPAPSFQVDDITRQFGVEVVGAVDGVDEHYYAIARRRRLQHLAVERILAAGA